MDSTDLKKIPPYAGAIIKIKGGKVALQRRDNKPGIQNPGMITLFGGRLGPKEDPQKGVIRELVEELNLPNDLEVVFLGCMKKTISEGDKLCYIFTTKEEISADTLILHEGAVIEYVNSKNYSDISVDATPLTMAALELFFRNN